VGCQQALEKLLKALVVEVSHKLPPRIHNLVRLATLADLSLDSHQDVLLGKLSLEYIELRYPEKLAIVENRR
jgi:HEPN domain-containing protein